MSSTTSDDSATQDGQKGPCGVCEGKFSEHLEGKTRHAWVPEGSSEMITHEQARKQKQQNQPLVIRQPANGQGPLQRLIEVLSNRGILSNGELMYVTGITGEAEDHGDGSRATHGG